MAASLSNRICRLGESRETPRAASILLLYVSLFFLYILTVFPTADGRQGQYDLYKNLNVFLDLRRYRGMARRNERNTVYPTGKKFPQLIVTLTAQSKNVLQNVVRPKSVMGISR